MELIIIPLIIVKSKRYELRKGKFGCYFYDNDVMIDMSLSMVLNRLNVNEVNKKNQFRSISNLLKDIINLKNELRELKIKLEVYKRSE